MISHHDPARHSRPPVYRRVLLKLSGEALMGDLEYGTDPDRVHQIASQIAAVHRRNVEVAIVVGGGNIYRGLAAETGENVVIRRFARFAVGG